MRSDKLAVTARTVPVTSAVASAAMISLLAGPTPAEASAGVGSAVPAGTVLRSVSVKGGTATVDLSSAFSSGGGSLSMTARLAQVVYTLTQFPTVSQVIFRLDGHAVTVFGGEGIVLDHPATRSGFESVTPPVLIESPAPGQQVANPLRVSGSANVFEAVFRLEATDATAKVLATRIVQATSGTGTRGTFDVSVRVPVGAAGPVTITAFVVSPKDGSRQDVARVSVLIGR
jgi:germination protein M